MQPKHKISSTFILINSKNQLDEFHRRNSIFLQFPSNLSEDLVADLYYKAFDKEILIFSIHASDETRRLYFWLDCWGYLSKTVRPLATTTSGNSHDDHDIFSDFVIFLVVKNHFINISVDMSHIRPPTLTLFSDFHYSSM